MLEHHGITVTLTVDPPISHTKNFLIRNIKPKIILFNLKVYN